MDPSETQFYDVSESDSDSQYSDDSQDPNFDVVEETRLTFSNLSVKAKTKTRVVKGMDEDVVEIPMPELDEKDQECYETIQKIIQGGQVERLKVDQCKIYLRKHGLRLSGNKQTLILRIKEHIEVVTGGGEKKYPASSFVFNCKGDACMGDIVMFEQNVYEEFSIASRSAKGPPCGTRVVAGRIVKESYGAAKQQHTFTIEVLWSKGEKPLGPLHQLLIKGRNLYRLKTMRRKWEDEGERQKILSQKHARGDAARSNREARIKQKEMRKPHKLPTRPTKAQHSNGNREVTKTDPSSHSVQHKSTGEPYVAGTCQPKISSGNPGVVIEGILGRQPLNSIINRGGFDGHTSKQQQPFGTRVQASRGNRDMFGEQNNANYFTGRSPVRVHHSENYFTGRSPVRVHHSENYFGGRSPVQVHHSENYFGGRSPVQVHRRENYFGGSYHVPLKENRQDGGCERRQMCRHYAQGRCYYGDRCKFSHEPANLL